MLAATTVSDLLILWECCLEVMLHYRVTIHLRKCRFIQQKAEFVGYDVLGEGNATAESKCPVFTKLEKPIRISNLRMLIGVFGFYHQYLEWFEQRIVRWRGHIRQCPKAGL